jgi:anaerobic selenocysteine-containing dehydrogenase
LADADQALDSLAPGLLREALERVPLVVSFAALPDDSSLMADWILPQAHALESAGLSLSPPGVSFPVVSYAAPVVTAPLADVRSIGDVVLALARRLGDPVAAAFPWPDVPALIQQEVEGLFDSHRGAILGTEFDEAWVNLMERAGWWAPGYRSAGELWTRLREAGGWWDPLYDHRHWSRVLRTPSGRFQLCPKELSAMDAQRERGGAAEPSGSLSLVLFEPLPIAGGTGAELPFLQAVIDPSHEMGWGTWVEIHPHTARALGVEDGAMVRVASSQGSIRARALVTERVVAGAAAIPVGLGKRAGGRWAQGIGANPLLLLGTARERWSGLPDPGAVRVQVLLEGA